MRYHHPRDGARLRFAAPLTLALLASALMAAPVAAQTPARSPTAAADSTAHTRWLISGSAGFAFATEQDYTAPIIGGRLLWWLDDLHALVLDGRFSRGGRDDVSPGCITGECAAAFGKARRLTTWFAGIESHIARAGTHQPVTFRLTAGVGQAVMLTPARTSGARRADSELAVNVGAVFETPVRGRLVARFETDATLAYEPGYFVALPSTKEIFAFRLGIGHAF